MSAAPGWYPDPGGQPGTFRYWDGRVWSPATTTSPYAAPPAPAPPPPALARPSIPGQPPSPAQSPTSERPAIPPRSPQTGRGWVGWLIGGLAVLVVLVVLAVVGIRAVLTGPLGGAPGPAQDTPGLACPPAVEPTASAAPDAGDRVRSGRLSYPRLGAPFSPPQWDSRTPFGRDVKSQEAVVETAADGRPRWVAAVLIARLLSGDGFYGPQQGAQVVAACVIGKFYDDAVVNREDRRNEATRIDGRDAWIIEMHLTFDIPDIQTKGEAATIVVVDTGNGEAGLFYSSIPDTSPQFREPAERALAGLTVD